MGRSTTTSSGSAQNGAQKAAPAAYAYARCMRTHGVPDFPDPNAKGEYAYGVSVTPAVFTKAVDACKALEPPGALSSKRTPAQQTASLRFAQCVRDNGVKDFPDPAPDAPLIDTNRIPSAARTGGMSILNAAMQKCRDLAANAGVSGGQ